MFSTLADDMIGEDDSDDDDVFDNKSRKNRKQKRRRRMNSLITCSLIFVEVLIAFLPTVRS